MRGESDPRYLAVMPLVFAMLHFEYGVGSLWGIVKLAPSPELWSKLFKLVGMKGQFEDSK